MGGCQRRKHELALELGPAAARAGVHARYLASCPSQIGDLVYRADQGWTPGLFEVQAGEGGGVTGEVLHKGSREDVEVVGPAVMAKVPRHLNVRGLGCPQQGENRQPIVAARNALHPVPTDPVACGPNPVARELLIVLERQEVVTRRGDQIEPTTVYAAMRRALEAAEKEAAEQGGSRDLPRAARRSVLHRAQGGRTAFG